MGDHHLWWGIIVCGHLGVWGRCPWVQARRDPWIIVGRRHGMVGMTRKRWCCLVGTTAIAIWLVPPPLPFFVAVVTVIVVVVVVVVVVI